jgi:hypothetical protein
VLVDAAVFLGPWGQLKSAAYAIGSLSWFSFAVAFLASALAGLPGLYALAVWASGKVGGPQTTLRQSLAYQGQVLVPLGLMAWIAFTISFAFTKFSYVLPVVSDPLGWGWNLIGMTNKAWVGQATSFSLLLEVAVLTVGLYWASRVARSLVTSTKQAIPMIAFSTAFTVAMLWLLVG